MRRPLLPVEHLKQVSRTVYCAYKSVPFHPQSETVEHMERFWNRNPVDSPNRLHKLKRILIAGKSIRASLLDISRHTAVPLQIKAKEWILGQKFGETIGVWGNLWFYALKSPEGFGKLAVDESPQYTAFIIISPALASEESCPELSPPGYIRDTSGIQEPTLCVPGNDFVLMFA